MRFWRNWGPVLFAWLAIMTGLYFGFSWFMARQQTPNRVENLSGTVLELQRSRDGHFRLEGRINDHIVPMLIDTGASGVSMDISLARRLGLPTDGPGVTLTTANGVVEGYETQVDTLRMGDIVLHNLTVTVSPAFGNPDEVLLGMNALAHLSITMQGNQLRLSVPNP